MLNEYLKRVEYKTPYGEIKSALCLDITGRDESFASYLEQYCSYIGASINKPCDFVFKDNYKGEYFLLRMKVGAWNYL